MIVATKPVTRCDRRQTVGTSSTGRQGCGITNFGGVVRMSSRHSSDKERSIMSCENPTFWRKLPVNSKFVISADGDETLFNIVVGVNVNGAPEEIWRHNEIVPGPRKRALAANEKCTFHVLVDLFHDPDAGTPVVVKAHVEKADGAPDPDRTCSSSFLQAGHFPLTFFFTV
jgi:hypothetical protein